MAETKMIKPNKLKIFFNSKWFAPALFLIAAILYFAAYLNFETALVGSDDGPRGWSDGPSYGYVKGAIQDKWSPRNGGTSMMEQRYGRFINPVYPLQLIMPKYKTRVLEYLMWVFVAGFSTFLFLRILGISRGSSIVVGLGYMFAPLFISFILGGHFARMEVIALLPLVMFFTERIIQKTDLKNAIGLPLAMALCIYSEHLQLAYFTFIGMGLYFAIKMIYLFATKKVELPTALARTGIFTLALTFGALLTSMSTIPSMSHTQETSKRAGGVDYEYASSFALHPEELITLLQPDFVGCKQTYWGQNPLKLNSEYFGAIFICLAALLFVIRRQGFNQYLFVGCIIFAVLFTLGAHTQLHKIMYNILPGMKAFRAPSMMYIWFFLPILTLAGYALDEISKLKFDPKSLQTKRLLVFGGIAGGLFLIFMVAAEPLSRWYYQTLYPLALQNQRSGGSFEANFPTLKSGALVSFLVIGAFLTLLFLKITNKINNLTFLTLLSTVILLDILRISRPFLTETAQPVGFYSYQERAEKSIADFINNQDKSHFRVYSMLGDQKMFIPGLEMAYFFDDFINKQYYDVINILQACSYYMSQPSTQNDPQVMQTFKNTLSFLNIKYVLSFSDFSIAGMDRITDAGNLRIYRDNEVFPRFYLAPVGTVVPDAKQAILSRLTTSTVGMPRDSVFFEKEIALPAQSAADAAIKDSITVLSFDEGQGKYSINLNSSRDQYLVMTENYTPGWTALVNGKPTPVSRMNYVWKGIVVPKGTSTVTFTHDSIVASKWRKITAIAAIVFALFAAGVVGFGVFKKK